LVLLTTREGRKPSIASALQKPTQSGAARNRQPAHNPLQSRAFRDYWFPQSPPLCGEGVGEPVQVSPLTVLNDFTNSSGVSQPE
jgi:hypothetical protein